MTNQGGRSHFGTLDTTDITAPFRFQGRNFAGLAELWNAHALDYAQHFPSENTLVFRSSDLLFQFADVMAELRRWLPSRRGAIFAETARSRDVARREDCRNRGLSEAQAFYSVQSNRMQGFSVEELQYMARMLDPKLMARWGYSHPRLPSSPPAPSDGRRRAQRRYRKRVSR